MGTKRVSAGAESSFLRHSMHASLSKIRGSKVATNRDQNSGGKFEIGKTDLSIYGSTGWAMHAGLTVSLYYSFAVNKIRVDILC